MKTTKRILALLLTVAMLATTLCLPAFAVDSTANNGTGATPITNATEFLAMEANGNYVLESDITLDTLPSLAAFSGTLDGGNYTVTVTNEIQGGALFASLNGATVKNLKVGSEEKPVSLKVVTDKSTYFRTGILATEVSGATVENVHVWTNVDYHAAKYTVRFGGFFGTVLNGNLSLKNCSANGSIAHDPIGENINGGSAYGQIHYVGGFVGAVNNDTDAAFTVQFDSCVNNMAITDRTFCQTGGVGGIVGAIITEHATVTMTNCLNTANMYVGLYKNMGTGKIQGFGGILGICKATADVTMTGCVNRGNMTGAAYYFGGLAGMIGRGATDLYAGTVNISNCVNYGQVKVTTTNDARVGGIVGNASPATGERVEISLCANYGELYATARAAGILCAGNERSYVGFCVNAGQIEVKNASSSNVGAIENYGDTNVSKCVTLTKPVYNSETEADPEEGCTLIAQTNVGAGVRIVNDTAGSGLRFKFTMDSASVDALATLTTVYGAGNVQVGSIFLLTEQLEDGKALTKENYSDATVIESNVSDITDGYYYAPILSLYEAQYNTAYSCQSFYRFRTSAEGEWITVYANNTLSRTVAGVADAALADTSVTYTAEQMALLETYSAANN